MALACQIRRILKFGGDAVVRSDNFAVDRINLCGHRVVYRRSGYPAFSVE